MWRQGKLVIGLFAAGQDAVSQVSDDTTIEARSEGTYLVGNWKALSQIWVTSSACAIATTNIPPTHWVTTPNWGAHSDHSM